MEELGMWAIKELPVAGAIIGVVVLFLKFMRAMMDSHKDTIEKRDAVIEKIADSFAETNRAQTEETKRLSANIGAFTEVIRNCPGGGGK